MRTLERIKDFLAAGDLIRGTPSTSSDESPQSKSNTEYVTATVIKPLQGFTNSLEKLTKEQAATMQDLADAIRESLDSDKSREKIDEELIEKITALIGTLSTNPKNELAIKQLEEARKNLIGPSKPRVAAVASKFGRGFREGLYGKEYADRQDLGEGSWTGALGALWSKTWGVEPEKKRRTKDPARIQSRERAYSMLTGLGTEDTTAVQAAPSPRRTGRGGWTARMAQDISLIKEDVRAILRVLTGREKDREAAILHERERETIPLVDTSSNKMSPETAADARFEAQEPDEGSAIEGGVVSGAIEAIFNHPIIAGTAAATIAGGIAAYNWSKNRLKEHSDEVDAKALSNDSSQAATISSKPRETGAAIDSMPDLQLAPGDHIVTPQPIVIPPSSPPPGPSTVTHLPSRPSRSSFERFQEKRQSGTY